MEEISRRVVFDGVTACSECGISNSTLLADETIYGQKVFRFKDESKGQRIFEGILAEKVNIDFYFCHFGYLDSLIKVSKTTDD